MHLSPFFEAVAAPTHNEPGASRTPGQMHVDGVLRGLVVLVSLALPFGVAAGASALHHHADAGRPAIESR